LPAVAPDERIRLGEDCRASTTATSMLLRFPIAPGGLDGLPIAIEESV